MYFSYASSVTEKVAVLNDLYTLPSARGKGAGRKLIGKDRWQGFMGSMGKLWPQNDSELKFNFPTDDFLHELDISEFKFTTKAKLLKN